jgi:hypothetical protein
MANHQQAKFTGNTSDFKKASKLYASVSNFVLSYSHQDERLHYLALLALNNRAQIHHEHFCDHTVSHHLFQSMSDILLSQRPLIEMNADDYHGLLQNAMCLCFPCAAGAA